MSVENDLIEREHYRKTLYEARSVIDSIISEIHGTDNPLLERIVQLSGDLRSGWAFRQHECPRCHGPAGFSVALSIFGPHLQHWDCPKCGVLHDSGDMVIETEVWEALHKAGWERVDGGGWRHRKSTEYAYTTKDAIACAIDRTKYETDKAAAENIK